MGSIFGFEIGQFVAFDTFVSRHPVKVEHESLSGFSEGGEFNMKEINEILTGLGSSAFKGMDHRLVVEEDLGRCYLGLGADDIESEYRAHKFGLKYCMLGGVSEVELTNNRGGIGR